MAAHQSLEGSRSCRCTGGTASDTTPLDNSNDGSDDDDDNDEDDEDEIEACISEEADALDSLTRANQNVDLASVTNPISLSSISTLSTSLVSLSLQLTNRSSLPQL